jgi:hypothetical protein
MSQLHHLVLSTATPFGGLLMREVGMADESQIRRENFKALAKTPKAAHEKLGGAYSYWRDLMTSPSKSFGEKVARRIEAAYLRPSGWLDVPRQRADVGADETSATSVAEPVRDYLAINDLERQVISDLRELLEEDRQRFIAEIATRAGQMRRHLQRVVAPAVGAPYKHARRDPPETQFIVGGTQADEPSKKAGT